MKKKKMGFTLVELLAVIVILAVILVIAVPKITEVIENSRKATFEASAKAIAAAAEKKKMENNILKIIGNTETISCSDVVNINDVDYSICSIKFDGNTAKVSLIGSGKFEGLQIIDGSKDNAVVETLSSVANYIKILYGDENTRANNGLKKDNTVDENIRYYGANPNNYVKFSDSDEVWRIIGVFGNNVKIVRSSSIGNLSWDTSDVSVNNGLGVNEWSQSDLKEYLNEMYYGDTTITCYGGANNTITNCPTVNISSKAKSMIDYHLWNTGAVNNVNDTISVYNAERGNLIGKICTSGIECTDTVERKTEWEGFVAIPSISDWGYASATDGCETKIQSTCKNDNWMQSSTTMWVLSAGIYSLYANHVWRITYDGQVREDYVSCNSYAVFPTAYLKSNVKIVSGSGTSTDAYILNI